MIVSHISSMEMQSCTGSSPNDQLLAAPVEKTRYFSNEMNQCLG